MPTNNQTDQKKGDDQKRAIQLNQLPALPGIIIIYTSYTIIIDTSLCCILVRVVDIYA